MPTAQSCPDSAILVKRAPMGEARALEYVRAVERCLRLLWCFAEVEELGVSELSRHTGLSPTTTYRLLRTLENHGFILQDPASGRYRLGDALLVLGNRVSASALLREVALPVMTEIRDATRESVHLNVPFNGDRLCVELVEGLEPLRLTISEVGARCPLHASGSGKVILAFLPESVQRMCLQGALERFTAKTVVDRATLEQQLTKIRSIGYYISCSERVVGAASVSAPILDPNGYAVASLTLSGPEFRWPKEKLEEVAPLVVRGALRISRKLCERRQQQAGGAKRVRSGHRRLGAK